MPLVSAATASGISFQFVEMKKFLLSNGSYDRDHLCKEILAEVPHQMVSFMTSRGFKPLHY